ncbi:formate dehydrogenase accessory sulfurtransferase FdhD [Variovorax boronicumulans]|uniref:formate dehydrogenase accessory sulfurtransferase FdhD n=1 Tax=Variovorax boronicumulans TaxID=436515 RepID=UPI00339738CF
MHIATLPAADGADTFCEGALLLPVHGVRDGQAYAVQDWVAEEVPVSLEFNGVSHAVMLATPLDLEDLALGFALGEGILDAAHELYSVQTVPSGRGITVRMEVASAAFARLEHRRRTLSGRTESLAQVSRELPVLADPAPFDCQAIARGMLQLQSLQTLQQATGAVHAAAWCSAQGEAMWLREDVGRHNALDKLIGALANNEVDASTGFIAVTGRASFEMVHKAAMAGVPLLATMSAPTSFAVATAERARLTLVGLARKDDLAAYSHPERVEADGQPLTTTARRTH